MRGLIGDDADAAPAQVREPDDQVPGEVLVLLMVSAISDC